MKFKYLASRGVELITVYNEENKTTAQHFTVSATNTLFDGDPDTQIARALLRTSLNIPQSFWRESEPYHFDLLLNRLKQSDAYKRFKAGVEITSGDVLQASERGSLKTFRTSPDEHGNVFEIDSEDEILARTVAEAVTWYRSERHHKGLSEPERGKHVWITTTKVPGGDHRGWKYSTGSRQ